MTDGGKHGRRRYWLTWSQCFYSLRRAEGKNLWLTLLFHFFGGWLLKTSFTPSPKAATQLSFVKASPQHLTRSTIKRTEIIHTHTRFHFMVGFLSFSLLWKQVHRYPEHVLYSRPSLSARKKLSRLHFISHIIVPSTNTIICGYYLWLVTCAAYPNAASGVYIIQEKKKKEAQRPHEYTVTSGRYVN